MSGLKIICVGSPFGDDQFGAWAYEMLSRVIDSDAADLIYLDRPGTRLIGAIEGAENVVLVDAIKSGATIGSVHRIDASAIYPHCSRHASSHGFGLVEALKLAERLGMLPSKLVLLGVEIGEFDTLAPLSRHLHASWPPLLQALHECTGLHVLSTQPD